ncbi:hypothetical protein ACIBF1_27305 [Spirillospora sp. NPDC050679]
MNERGPDEQEREAARLLGALRGFEPPGDPSPGAPGRAVRAGRRRVRARRGAAAALSAAAVAAAVVLPGSLPPSGGGGRPVTGAERFDPSRPAFRVGSAGGFTPASYQASPGVQRALLRPEDPDGPLRGTDGVVEMYPEGDLPPGSAGKAPAGRAAPDVHDRRARWLDAPVLRPGAVEMAWEWKPGAWGFVSLKGPGANRARTHLVALGVVPAGTPGVPDTPPATASPRASATPAAPGG